MTSARSLVPATVLALLSTLPGIGLAGDANNTGYAYIRQHKFAEAIPHLAQAVNANPDHKVAWNNLAFCHLALYEAGAADKEALNSALTALEKVAALDPEYRDVDTKVSQIEAYLAQEERWIEAARKREGQPPGTVAATGTYRTYKLAGEAAEQEGDFALAQRNFEKAEEVGRTKRTKSAAANFQGLLALKMRKPQTAVRHCRRAASLNPSNKYAWNNLGASLLKMLNAGKGGRELVEEAIEAFKRVAELDSSYKPENLALARSILAEVGEPTEEGSDR